MKSQTQLPPFRDLLHERAAGFIEALARPPF